VWGGVKGGLEAKVGPEGQVDCGPKKLGSKNRNFKGKNTGKEALSSFFKNGGRIRRGMEGGVAAWLSYVRKKKWEKAAKEKRGERGINLFWY